ncbi:MAG TPA: hypothetical protein VMH87_01890, partial [Pseudomonadales bacterium]|nr:hypothetical protein [Pseudomonadales bacterium]
IENHVEPKPLRIFGGKNLMMNMPPNADMAPVDANDSDGNHDDPGDKGENPAKEAVISHRVLHFLKWRDYSRVCKEFRGPGE